MELVKKKVTLMGPGPSDVASSVSEKMAYPTIGHLDPDFVAVMDDIKKMLRQVFRSENKMTFPLSAPGSAGMEASFANVLEPGEKVIIFENGVFGGRMAEMANRQGLEVVREIFEWGQPVCPERVAAAVAKHGDAKAVAFVHAETSTGVLSDCEAICAEARKADMLTIVDTVTSLAGSRLEVDAWGVDVVYSGTQKCLSAPPGISPMSFSQRALAKVARRKTKPLSWFLDVGLLAQYWQGSDQKRSYHHTAPVNSMYALHEALRLVLQEGLEKRWQRHEKMHERLKSSLAQFGLRFFVDEASRTPQLNTVLIPEGVDDTHVRSRLLTEHGIEIGGGLGPLAGKVWRIGLMGESASLSNITKLEQALSNLLN